MLVFRQNSKMKEQQTGKPDAFRYLRYGSPLAKTTYKKLVIEMPVEVMRE